MRKILICVNIRKYKILGNSMNIGTKLPDATFNIFKNVINEETRILAKMFKSKNFTLRIAGGAVRDILMNITPHDIDFATDASPSQMKEMFMENDIRMINTNGESHGTITARINDKENFEVTTLRIDKVTDGRRAEVEFTKDWELDAERRDLTINSMFLDMDGLLYDFFGGLEDIRQRRVRFVGDTVKRIQEDYLRILRYFRFYGRIAEHMDSHCEGVLENIQRNSAGLARISGERLWTEMRKIVSGNHGPAILVAMKQCQLLPHLGLDLDTDLHEYNLRYSSMCRHNCPPSAFLAQLLKNKSQLCAVVERLRVSNDELYTMRYLIEFRGPAQARLDEKMEDEALLTEMQDEAVMWAHNRDLPAVKLPVCQQHYLHSIDCVEVALRLLAWTPPRFPVRGHVLSQAWQLRGNQIGLAMTHLKLKWKDSGYIADSSELLSEQSRKDFLI